MIEGKDEVMFWKAIVMVRECWGLNYEAAGEGFEDVNSERGARLGFGGVSADSARMVMKVEQDEALGGHLGVGN
ncbi:hypothetical protein V6N11_058282 [Hibiscus sabdariffa]|uniref:Uncharacterized protein n=1 Tax=Hibiscus sabdariffa TaxID=183260 RepID=A0ABR1ZBL9_9ROSI